MLDLYDFRYLNLNKFSEQFSKDFKFRRISNKVVRFLMKINSLEHQGMNFNFEFKKLNKKNYHRKKYGKILTVRLPCNPIFPIGPIYLADHIHKCFHF